MNRKTTWNALVAFVAVAALALHTRLASAATVSSGVSLNTGNFSTTISGTGSATVTGGGGNYRQWASLGFLGWQSTNIGVSLSNQTVGIHMSNVNVNAPASGSANLTFDDNTPPTPISLDSLDADLNGAGGSNQNYNFSIGIDPISISVAGILSTSIALTVNGTITDAVFHSTGGSAPGAVYSIPGNLDLTLQGSVTGVLDPGGLNINLGTIYTLAPTTLSTAVALPGLMVLTDLSGGAGPFPADMAVDLGAAIPFPISVPLSLPVETHQNFSLGTHQSGFTHLDINAGSAINATFSFGNPSYDLQGVIPSVVVPEPGTLAMGSMALVALSIFSFRRRKSA